MLGSCLCCLKLLSYRCHRLAAESVAAGEVVCERRAVAGGAGVGAVGRHGPRC